MKAVRLVAEPFQFTSLLEVECVKVLNEHGSLRISGIISEKDGDRYQEELYEEYPICLRAVKEDDSEIILFQGIIIGISIQIEGQVYKLQINARTGSYLLDRKPHIRLFQDDSMSYEDVMHNIIKEAGGDLLMIDQYQEKIGRFVVQYKETDWAFCKRLSNNLALPLLPEFQRVGKLFHIGLNSKKGGTLESKEYSLETSMPSGWKEPLILSERGIYKIESRDIYQLGEQIIFNKKSLAIAKVESYLQGGELWNRYYLCRLKTELDSLYYNKRIQGISMRGMVQAVKGAQVEVSIHEDERQTKGGYWFDYATVYSTPDGTGWYCMPEIGDEIRLNFPMEDEGAAYVAGNVHLDGGAGRDNPDQKFWKNKQGKEIRFTPSSLSLSNSAGLSVILDDASGIQISSNKGIYLTGDQKISINSQAGIQISGNDNVSIWQGDASIQMDGEINISGGKINLN